MISTRGGGEVAERAAGEVDRHRGDARAALGERGLGPHALAGGERGAEQLVGHRAGGARRQRRLVGALDLALHLGLADDHRVQAARHPIEMARRVAVAQRVDRVDELGGPDAGPAGEHPEHR